MRPLPLSLAGASGAFVLLACSAIALAQPDVDCRKTETQAECFTRLKCKANEELEDCQKRLRASSQGQGQGNAGDRHDGDNRAGDRGGDNRADDRGGDHRGRDDGGDDRGRGREREAWGNDRVDRDDRGGERGSRRRHGGRGFTANKTFGLGLELGEPDGLNGKYFVSDSGALDFGVGYIYDHYYYGDGVHLYADYLFHVSLASTAAFELPFYIGGGLRYWDFNYCYQGLCKYGGSAVGIRVPLGIAFDLNNAPLDIFLQLVPVVDFLGGNYYMRYNSREHFGIDGSVGIRFWFK